MVFNDRDYTKDAVIKQLGLIELHTKDGSAMEAGCQCIDTKHLYLIEGLAEEGQGFALSAKEREFYAQLGDLSRLLRKRMEVEDYNIHGAMREVMSKAGFKTPIRHDFVKLNPAGRLFLPHGFTKCEKQYPSVQKRLASCIRSIEKKEDCRPPYTDCRVNPVAVCRASIKCPPS